MLQKIQNVESSFQRADNGNNICSGWSSKLKSSVMPVESR
jgi:hypothetical protein